MISLLCVVSFVALLGQADSAREDLCGCSHHVGRAAARVGLAPLPATDGVWSQLRGTGRLRRSSLAFSHSPGSAFLWSRDGLINSLYCFATIL